MAATNARGAYDPSLSLSSNLALASPLLSRFDLVLVLQDTRSGDWDRYNIKLSSRGVLRGAASGPEVFKNMLDQSFPWKLKLIHQFHFFPLFLYFWLLFPSFFVLFPSLYVFLLFIFFLLFFIFLFLFCPFFFPFCHFFCIFWPFSLDVLPFFLKIYFFIFFFFFLNLFPLFLLSFNFNLFFIQFFNIFFPPICPFSFFFCRCSAISPLFITKLFFIFLTAFLPFFS